MPELTLLWAVPSWVAEHVRISELLAVESKNHILMSILATPVFAAPPPQMFLFSFVLLQIPQPPWAGSH